MMSFHDYKTINEYLHTYISVAYHGSQSLYHKFYGTINFCLLNSTVLQQHIRINIAKKKVLRVRLSSLHTMLCH